jgi:hypothetical protein
LRIVNEKIIEVKDSANHNIMNYTKIIDGLQVQLSNY